MGAVLSTVAGNPCSILSPVPSAALLHCVDVRLTLREWLDARRFVREVGRDGGNEVVAEPTSSESENRYFVRGFMRGASGESKNQ